MKSYMFCVMVFLMAVFHANKAHSQSPDLILTHGKIFTADKNKLYVEAIAIKGNTILATGSNDYISKMAGKNTAVIDLGGKTVVPGFNDAHYHHSPYVTGYAISFPPDGREPSWQELKDSIINAVKLQSPGTFLNATMGIDVGTDTSINRFVLDQLAPSHPLLIQSYWGHVSFFNSAAIKALGLSETEPNIPGGTFGRTQDGKTLNGQAYEYACDLLRSRRSTNDALFSASLQDLGKEALYFGVTSIQNMCTGASPEEYISQLQATPMPVRFRLIRWAEINSNGTLHIPAKKLSANVKALPLVSLSGTKWMMDGTPIERSAWVSAAYKDQPGVYGYMNFTPEQIKKILAELNSRKDQPMFHVVGDATINYMLKELAALPQSWVSRRIRFEHGDAVMPSAFAMAKKLNIIVVQNPSHFTIVKTLHDRFSNTVLSNMQPMSSLLKAGIPVAIGSDGPLNPYLNIMFACMHPSNPKEAISVEEAVIAYTKTSAYAEGRDDKGTLSTGKLADLVVLSQDIFTVPLPQLSATHSVLTMVNGKIVTTSLAQSKKQKLDEIMKTYHRYNMFDGSVLVAENGKVIYKAAFGMANREWNVL
ncbi:MAG: amidohydrolase family protein, partial [Chitinophagaceae bacterium]